MPGWHLFSRVHAQKNRSNNNHRSQKNYSRKKPNKSWYENLKRSFKDFGLFKSAVAAFTVVALFTPVQASAIDIASTAAALRIANTITGGLMPTSDPIFAQMVTKVAAGDKLGAAQLAANSVYFSKYLARRLALQMMTPAMDASTSTDNDASAFLVAHFVGAQSTTAGQTLKPAISSIWSDNSTYLVNVTANGTTTPTHAAALTAAQFAAVNWSTDLVQQAGQNAKAVTTANGTTTATNVAIPSQHVGGYLTLSDRPNDNSFAQYGATAGTNLRMIEGMWEIATGLQLLDVASVDASPSVVPRFVPEYNSNFFVGQGQTACIACHGGGFASINHGYATVADIFDFTAANGLAYIATPTTATMKSLASDAKNRTNNAACNLVKTPTAVCNPDSVGVGTTQAWDLASTWSSAGILKRMGWSGSTSGNGLNQLGAALGKASIVYEYLTKRVVGEICPMGAFTQTEVSNIAAQANPFASTPGTDDIRTIVSLVASHASCQ